MRPLGPFLRPLDVELMHQPPVEIGLARCGCRNRRRTWTKIRRLRSPPCHPWSAPPKPITLKLIRETRAAKICPIALAYDTQRPAMRAKSERVRKLTSESQPSGKLASDRGARGTLIWAGGNLSP